MATPVMSIQTYASGNRNTESVNTQKICPVVISEQLLL